MRKTEMHTVYFGKTTHLLLPKNAEALGLLYVVNQPKVCFMVCVCDCGKERVTTSSCLKTGSVKSCGCTKRESTQSRIKDMLGKRLGRLVVVERLDKNAPGGSVLWRCKCNCGKEHISSGTLLRS